jgi:CDP-diglyceride synthetase
VHTALIVHLTLLVAVANGTPVLATRLARGACGWPVDWGARWLDGRPVFGASKTYRGLALSLVVTSVYAAAVGLTWSLGATVAAAAMAGDLISSFTKRRLGRAAGSRATGLDQVPEALLPLLVCAGRLSLTAVDVAVVVGLFAVGDVMVSRVLYRLRIRDHPY